MRHPKIPSSPHSFFCLDGITMNLPAQEWHDGGRPPRQPGRAAIHLGRGVPMYGAIEMPYLPGKIVVSGANGRNGIQRCSGLMSLPGVSELVALVPESVFINEVQDRLRAYEESLSSHSHPEVLVTDDPKQPSMPRCG